MITNKNIFFKKKINKITQPGQKDELNIDE